MDKKREYFEINEKDRMLGTGTRPGSFIPDAKECVKPSGHPEEIRPARHTQMQHGMDHIMHELSLLDATLDEITGSDVKAQIPQSPSATSLADLLDRGPDNLHDIANMISGITARLRHALL